MIDVESVFASEVEAIVPAPGAGGADWQDVERRAGLPAARRRRVALAVALLAAIFAAAALADAFGGFGTWLSGEPGKPASPAAQRAFARSIRTWVGFPQGTQLRELARTTAGREAYTLYGFRGSGSLCLRLDVTGREAATDLVCPPLAQLRGSPAPALPAEVDYPVGAGRRIANGPFDFTLPGATVTFGIVADSVTHVKVAHSDGRSIDAVVSGDAFLAVDDHPSPTERVLAISAGDGRTTVRVPFSSSAPPTRAVAGPTRVQRAVHGDAIRWFARRQARGTAVPRNLHGAAGVGGSAIFAREITPSRTAPERIVISIAPAGDRYFGGRLRNKKVVCAVAVGGRYPGAGGCWPAGRLFSTGPFAVGVSQDASSRYLTLAGLAGDDVARLALFLDNGTVFKVPLHDNGFVVEAPTSGYPLNLVAYDTRGLVIGTKVFRGSESLSVPAAQTPDTTGDWRRLVQQRAGTVWEGPSLKPGVDCAVIRLTTSGPAGPTYCLPIPRLALKAIGSIETVTMVASPGAEATQTLLATVGSAVAKLVVQLEGARSQTVEAAHGYAIAVIPPTAKVGTVVAYDASGKAVATYVPPPRLTGGVGRISALGASSISFAAGKVSCRLTGDSPSTSRFRAGERVQYLCRGGTLTLIGRILSNQPTLRAHGAIVALTSSEIVVRNTLAKQLSVTCKRSPASPPTKRFTQGEVVQIFCSHGELTGINGAP